MARTYRNYDSVKVTKTTTGSVKLFLQKTKNDYEQGKEGKAPSNKYLLITRVRVEGSPDTDPATVLKALKGATLTLYGQSGDVRELGAAFLNAKEANPWVVPEAFNLDVPVAVPPAANYSVELNWQEANALGDSETAHIYVVVEGLELSPEEYRQMVNG